MLKIVGFLFPWRKTFRRFQLERRWWHRLAVVLFFVVLVLVLLYAWIISDDARGPAHSLGGVIQYWQILPALPSGYTLVQTVTPVTSPPDASSVGPGKIADPLKDIFDVVASNVSNSDLRKTIEMPDGTTATYPGTTSDKVIQAAWKHKLNVARARAALLEFGLAVLVTVIFSYVLQAAYRALLYVIFGPKAKNIPESPTAAR